MVKKVFITGGAGYIGCVLTPLLLKEGYQVTVYDNLMYGGDGLMNNFSDPNFSIVTL